MANQILFDRLTYLDRLKRAGVSEEHARAHADAMDEALRESVATKHDVALLRSELRSDLGLFKSELRSEMELLKRDMTIRFGAMQVVLFGLLAAIKFFA